MKLFFRLVLLFFVKGLAFGQAFGIEHHYPEGIAKRINLEYSGEKYVVLDTEINQINLYNPDHSFWKSVTLHPPAQGRAMQVHHISEALINPDPALEIAYSFMPNNSVHSRTIIVAEDGTVLKPPTVSSHFFSIEEGLEPKLITFFAETSLRIFKLQGLVLEHSYTGYLQRIRLEVSGEKYFRIVTVATTSAEFLNADLTPWKTIALPVPEDVTEANVIMYSENEINNDPLMEIAYRYYDPQLASYVTRICNENGQILLTIVGVHGYVYVDKLPGLENKLMVQNSIVSGQFETHVYSLGTFTREHTYPGFVRRINLELSGEKYFIQEFHQESPVPNTITIYNADHTTWKTILLPVPTPTQHVAYVDSISQTFFVADPQLEMSYRCDYNIGQTVGPEYACIANESQEILLAVPHANEIVVDRTAGFEPKIFAQLYIPSNASVPNGDFETKIYKIDNTTGVCGQDSANLVLFPNPADQTFVISNDCPIVNAEIYAITGALIKTENAEMLENIDVSELASGLYLIKLTNVIGRQSTHKLMVTH